jgi:hypothetical protein
MKKGIVIGIIVGVIIIAALIGGFMFFGKEESSGSTWTPIEVNQDNVASVMSQSSLVRDVPEEGVVAFYVGNTGYTITKGNMVKGAPANPDITLRMPESYLTVLGQYGWCVALQQANQNQELGMELHGSTASTAWKYRTLEKYRLCLG